MDDSILCGRCRDGKVGMAEFDCIGDDLALGICIDKLEAAVGFHGWTNVKGSGGKNVFFSNGPNSTSEFFNLLY